MMKFRLVTDALIDLLGNAEKGRFKTIGFMKRKASGKLLNELRTVQVYYSNGEFPPSGRQNIQHDITYRLELIASAESRVDLSVLEDPYATDYARANVLARAKSGSEHIQDDLDEFMELIYQIVMDGQNMDLGFDIGTVVNLWISGMQKDPIPFPQGQRICVGAIITLNLRVAEDISGDIGKTGESIDIQIDAYGDDVEKVGQTIQISS